jgi:hypothetical protein
MVKVDDYPNLALIAWNRRARVIEDAEALALYEANWRFVDVSGMSADEKALIERLVVEYGNGVLLV